MFNLPENWLRSHPSQPLFVCLVPLFLASCLLGLEYVPSLGLNLDHGFYTITYASSRIFKQQIKNLLKEIEAKNVISNGTKNISTKSYCKSQ